jgi:outer membrane protein TolC
LEWQYNAGLSILQENFKMYMRFLHKLLTITGILILGITNSLLVHGQKNGILTLPHAIQTGIGQYQSIQSKENYLHASQAIEKQVKNQYLPDVFATIQQVYGTVNGQMGPAAAFGPAAIASAGPGYSSQSWNAGFGSIYLLNTNWEFVSFGRVHSRIVVAHSQVQLDSSNIAQEKFIHSVRIAGAYLNLLIAQRLLQTTQSNLERAGFLQQAVIARTKSGLAAGVDSSISNAELSSARLQVIQAINKEQELSNQLAQLLNNSPAALQLDTSLFYKTPTVFQTARPFNNNPQLVFFENRIRQNNSLTVALKKSIYPGLNLLGSFQSRGSGFDYNYSPAYSDRYSKNYFNAVNPSRYNYLIGLGISWNLMSPVKINQQVKAQQFITAAYQNDYDLINTQLKDQALLADQQIENSLASIKETPLQLKAASDAYLQKTVLYKNGLTTIVDVQQTLYALNRAQTDISIAYINVWQALLLKAASVGDFDLFINQVQ